MLAVSAAVLALLSYVRAAPSRASELENLDEFDGSGSASLKVVVDAIVDGKRIDPHAPKGIPVYPKGWGNYTKAPLRFTEDGTFQIAIFEDLHFAEGPDQWWGPQHDNQSVGVMNSVLDAESPQLVVINGDWITGENTYLQNASKNVDEIVTPMLRRNLPWAGTYGNHDSDFNISRMDIYHREKRWNNSLTGWEVHGRNAGVSNYYLPVYSADTSKTFPELILWFFDSRGGWYKGEIDPTTGGRVGQPGWVDESVIAWFNKTKNQMAKEYEPIIPSLAFFHIPLGASTAWQIDGAGWNSTQQPGIDQDSPMSPQGLDSNGNYIGTDLPFARALLDTPGLIATFSGHDHGNDWCFKWNMPEEQLDGTVITGSGLDVCLSRHTGYGGYSNWVRGSRQIILNSTLLSQGIVDTYNRMEDKSILGAITLNSTYGTDQYPVVPVEQSNFGTCIEQNNCS